MVGLLPENYRQIFKREKIISRLFSILVVAGTIFLFGLAFILPSYFSLVFSLDDVLRSLGTEEISIKRKDVDGLEERIFYANFLSNAYFAGESKRKQFSELLISLTNLISNDIKLTSIEFQMGSGNEFVFNIKGEATTRNALVLYSQKLRALPQVRELRSPVSNLLQEINVKFLLEAVINKQYYDLVKN